MSKKLQAESLQAEVSTKDKIKNALNAYTPLLRENFKSTFVTLQGGKDLSTNDFTNDFKAKLTSIEGGAQVNKLEKILLNGTNISISADKSANISITASDNNFTDAYKTKLDSIQSGAEVNVIENISVNGENVSIDNKTANIILSADNSFVINNHTVNSASISGATLNFDDENKSANISITGGGAANFTVNGAEVTAMSVVGAASVSTQSDTAIVSITGGEAQSVTINGAESNVISISGAAQVSQGGGVTNLIIADRTPKASANFAVTPANVTLNALQPATISASRLGDGTIGWYSSRFANIEQISATEFRISPKHAGSGNVGFMLDETETYYPASKNVQIYSPEITPHILMHFDDASDIWKNDGYNLTPTVDVGVNASIESGGKFGSYLKVQNGTTRVGAALGGDDFTIEYFSKYLASTAKANDLKAAGVYFGLANITATNAVVCAPNADRTSTLYYSLSFGLTDWTHCTFCYNHTAGELNFFVGGVLRYTWEVTYAEMATEFAPWPCVDELRIVKGACIYTEDFTPPTEPF